MIPGSELLILENSGPADEVVATDEDEGRYGERAEVLAVAPPGA
ncbi:hypothetical protein ACFRFU_37235 [Streptomyces sp. NPDC056704]